MSNKENTYKKCPFCAEKIKKEALKCKHCNSFLEINKKIKADKHESYKTITLVSILLPIIGIILGIVYLTKKDPLEKKLGEHAIAFSILFMILWSIFLSFIDFSLYI